MNVYRIADLDVAYTPHSDYTAALLDPYRTESASASLTVTLSPSDIQNEASLFGVQSGKEEASALLRALSLRLPRADRLMLHAAAVVKDGAAYAFVAPSGVGKTTHARLWEKRHPQGVYILNGDRLFVHIQSHGATAFGSPWCGKEGLGQNASAPLKALFVLTRSDTAFTEPLSPADALVHLLRATLYPKAQSDRLTVLSLLESLATHTPLYRLYAPLSVDAVDAVNAALAQRGGPL